MRCTKYPSLEKLRDIISIAPPLRRQHLHELAIALELDEEYPKGKAIRKLRAIKQMNKTHVSISVYMKSSTSKYIHTLRTRTIFLNRKILNETYLLTQKK